MEEPGKDGIKRRQSKGSPRMMPGRQSTRQAQCWCPGDATSGGGERLDQGNQNQATEKQVNCTPKNAGLQHTNSTELF